MAKRKIKKSSKPVARKRTSRPPEIRAFFGEEIIADNFAGGGGASHGIELALGRSPDLAVNHCAEAIAMHTANHPKTRHYIEDVWRVDPRKACAGRPVGLAWFSPDCSHFSSAKGDVPKENRIRGLAWVAVRWAASVAPRVIVLENVREFLTWGPLHKHHVDGCRLVTARDKGGHRIVRDGAPVKVCKLGKECHYGKPIKARAGSTFKGFCTRLRKLGYTLEWKLLKACDYGAPTSRLRLFLIARRDGRPIVWPAPTHGPGTGRPYRTAAECIDWTIPCPSIFDRDEPLADNTLARIARGMQRFVLENGRPFIVPVNHGKHEGRKPDLRVHDSLEPLRTVTAHGRGAHAIAVPQLMRYNGERRPGEDRKVPLDEPLPTVTTANRFAVMTPMVVKLRGTSEAHLNSSAGSVEEPLDTISAQGEHHAVVAPFLIAKSWGEREGQAPRCMSIEEPLGTVMAGGIKHAVAVAWLMKNYGGNYDGPGQAIPEPLGTVTARDHHSLVSAFLVRYNGESEAQGIEAPMGTLTTKDRYSLVTVTIAGEEWVVVDIGMRMLEPRELFNAQGFEPDYQIDVTPIWSGKRLTRTAQVRCAGNSVCPPLAAAIVRAQLAEDAGARPVARAA